MKSIKEGGNDYVQLISKELQPLLEQFQISWKEFQKESSIFLYPKIS